MGKIKKAKKRSFVAAIISFIGSIVLVWGLYLILSELFIIFTSDNGGAGRIILGILVIVLCAVIQYASILYDKFMEHRRWMKRLRNAGIEEELSSSDELAWQAYRSNPTSLGLKYIEEHNPKVGAEIRKHLASQPSNPVEKLLNSIFKKLDSAEKAVKKEAPKRTTPFDADTKQDWENDETIIR